jgi:hypothetical protein
MTDRDYYYDGIKEPTANQSEKSTHVFAKGNKNTHIVATVLHRITPNFRGHISAGVQFTGLLTNRIIRIPTVSPVVRLSNSFATRSVEKRPINTFVLLFQSAV